MRARAACQVSLEILQEEPRDNTEAGPKVRAEWRGEAKREGQEMERNRGENHKKNGWNQ